MVKKLERMNTPDHVFYIIGSYMTVLFIASVSFNIFVTFIFCRIFKRKKNTVNLIIINLSIANALHGLAFIVVIIASFMKKWSMGDSACALNAFLFVFVPSQLLAFWFT